MHRDYWKFEFRLTVAGRALPVRVAIIDSCEANAFGRLRRMYPTAPATLHLRQLVRAATAATTAPRAARLSGVARSPD